MGTNADHQAAWRARQREKQQALERELAALRKGGRAAELVQAKQRLAEQDAEIERLKAAPPRRREAEQLSMTAQEKLGTAIRQHKRKLDMEFEVRVLDECKRRLNEMSLPQYAKELAELERSISNRKGIMDRATFRKIRACLHPDRVQDEGLKKSFAEAFRLFSELEKRVLDEKQSPTEFRKMPRTYEELMAMRRKVQEDRRAKREATRSR
jgi:hypothetical protein